MANDHITDLYSKYTANSYRVIFSTGYSARNEFRDLRDAMAYAAAKKPIGAAWQKAENRTLAQCREWLNQEGWLAVVMPENLIAVDVDGHPTKQAQYAALNKKHEKGCGIHQSTNGKHYVYLLPRDSAERDKIKASSAVLTKCGLILTYRVGGKSNIIVEPTPGRVWETFKNNDELCELPPEFRPIDHQNSKEVETALAFQLGQAYRNNQIQGNEHIDMMFMGSVAKSLNLPFDRIEAIFEKIYGQDYNEQQTRANYERAKTIEQVQGAKSLFEVLKEKELFNLEQLLSLFIKLEKKGTQTILSDKPTNEVMNFYVIQFIHEHKIIFVQEENEYYKQFNGVYVPMQLQEALTIFQKFLGVKYASPSRINHMKSFFINEMGNRAFDKNTTFFKMLLLDDKVFEVKTGRIRNREENEVFFYRLNVNYNPTAKFERYEQFLKEIFPFHPEAISFLQEYMGYSLTAMTKHEMALIFRGEGANGKSVLLFIWQYILGKQNISSLSMTQFKSEFLLVALQNKLLNICHEIGTREIIPEDLLKRIISGEDITVNRKYKEALTFKPFAKLVFSSNNRVISLDKSQGTTRRYVYLPFLADFDSAENRKKKDPDLKYKIVREEADGVFHWMLQGLERLLKRGHFDIPLTLVENTKKENNETNAIYEYANEYVYWGNETDFVSSKDLYNEYKKFCLMNGYSPKNHNYFTTDFKRVVKLDEAKHCRTVRGNRGYKYVTLRTVPYDVMKREYVPELEESQNLYVNRVGITSMSRAEFEDTTKNPF